MAKMIRVFDKDITYRKFRGGDAIRRFRDKYAELFPDIMVYLEDDMIAYLIQYDDITYSDINLADGSINHEWTYSINYENGYDYTYISLTVREPEPEPVAESEHENINNIQGRKNDMNTNTNTIKDILNDLMSTNNPVEKMGKFEKDLLIVNRILSADTITAADRMQLLKILNIAFHKGGKIEGIYSIDSTATNCSYCKAMRKAAKNIIKHICNYCYDYEQEHSFKGRNVLNRHTLNMVILSAVEFTDAELATLNIIGLCRFNSSGDIQNHTMALNYFKIAKNNPFAKFALWAKNVAAVKYAINSYGKPDNLTLIFSNPIINGRPVLPGGFDYTFSVYTPGKIDAVLSGGDYMECNGKKCKDCGYKCYLKLWPVGANIAEKLRANKDLITRIDAE